MSAYCLYILHELYDRAALEAYWQALRPTLADIEVRMLSSYRPFDKVEGDLAVDAIVLVEFANIDDARAWQGSEAYQTAKQLRASAGRFTGLLVDGGITPADQRNLIEVPRP